MEYKIDAADKILGRLASEVAILLRGKHEPSFSPSVRRANRITVYHTDGIRVSGKKMGQKLYRRHSGYHGGLKSQTLKEVMVKDSRRAVAEAVSGMLPKNRTRKFLLKHLILIKGDLPEEKK